MTSAVSLKEPDQPDQYVAIIGFIHALAKFNYQVKQPSGRARGVPLQGREQEGYLYRKSQDDLESREIILPPADTI